MKLSSEIIEKNNKVKKLFKLYHLSDKTDEEQTKLWRKILNMRKFNLFLYGIVRVFVVGIFLYLYLLLICSTFFGGLQGVVN